MMDNLETPASASTRSSAGRRRDGHHHQRTWASALTLAAILAAQDNSLTVTAFQPSKYSVSRIRPLTTTTQQLPSSSLFGTVSPSYVDESSKTGLLWGHERSTPAMTIQVPSRMFLKAGQVSNQPMSALSSNFFDSAPPTSTTAVRPGEEELRIADLYYTTSRRTRGVLGFAVNPDHGDHVISSPKSPPSMEDSSTSLHSSTERQSRSSSSFSSDFETWTLPNTLDEEEWASANQPQNSNQNNNPILNRSPNANDDTKKSRDSLAWFPWMPTISQIEALKVRELRKICSERGIRQVSLAMLFCGIVNGCIRVH